MAININNLGNNNPVNQQLKNQADAKVANQQSATTHQPKAAQDSVSITPQAKQLAEAQKKANDAPVVNQKKVDQLKKAIESGEYKVNADKLAQSLAKFEFDLL